MINKELGTKVTILGQEYSLIGKDINDLQEAAGYVDKTLKYLQSETNQYSSGRLGILACLNMADQLRKLKIENEKITTNALNSVNNLISKIDSLLSAI